MSCIIKRILTLQIPIQYKPIKITDSNNIDITNSCMYSWSTDMVCWTGWVDYTSYQHITPNIESDFYLRVLLFGSFSNIYLDNSSSTCYDICLYNENPYLLDLCSLTNIDLYSNLECALLMQQQLSDLICCMIGIPCYYFRVSPQEDTADYTFKEYILHNVIDVKHIKLVCQEGALPSSRPQMTEFDFDWDNDWEVEVGKTMFAQAFGDTSFPKQRDFIYVPMMKRMFEVNSAYDEKQEMLMWRATTWKLGLVKWTDKSNIDPGDFSDMIDGWIENNYEDDWYNIERVEQERQTGIIQTDMPKFAETNLTNIFMEDNIRKSITSFEMNNIIPKQINHGAIITTKNFYKFDGRDSIIKYQKKWCGDSGELMFICSPYKLLDSKKTILSLGYVTIDINPNEEGVELEFNGSKYILKLNTIYQVICKWNRSNFTTEMIIREHSCDNNNVPIYRLRHESYKFNETFKDTQTYNNDYNIEEPVEIICSPYPLLITNIKLYNRILEDKIETKESIKYTTNNEYCIFNDVARPFDTSHGYDPK